MKNKNPVERAVSRIGSQRKVAAMMTPPVTQASVWKWCHRGWAPLARARQLSDMSGVPVASLISPEDARLLGLHQ